MSKTTCSQITIAYFHVISLSLSPLSLSLSLPSNPELQQEFKRYLCLHFVIIKIIFTLLPTPRVGEFTGNSLERAFIKVTFLIFMTGGPVTLVCQAPADPMIRVQTLDILTRFRGKLV